MPTINDEDTRYDPNDLASQEERNLIARNTGGAAGSKQPDAFDDMTSPENYAKSGESGSLSGGPKSTDEEDTAKSGDTSDKGSPKPKDNEGTSLRAKADNKIGSAKAAGNRLLKNKWVVGLSGVSMGTIAVVVIVMIVMMSAFKVPHLMENITTWRFSRVFQQAVSQNERTMGSRIAVAIADSDTAAKYKAKYGEKAGKVKDLYDKSAKWSPNRSIKNLQNSNMEFHYTKSRLGVQRLSAITLNDRQIIKPQVSVGKKLIPGYKFVQDYKFSKNFAPEFNEALRANEVGTFVRGVAGKRFAEQRGINFIAWKLGEYRGKSSSDAAVKAVQQSIAAEETAPPPHGSTEELNSKADEVKEKFDAAKNDPAQIKEGIKNGGMFKSVQATLSTVGEQGIFKTTLGVLSPTYAIAAPVCIIYDGSISRAGPTIDRNSTAHIKAYNHMSTVGDQIKDGTTVDAAIVRAYDDKIGPDINSSPPLQTAAGKIPTTTGGSTPQAGPAGIFTAFNVIFGGSDGSGFAVDAANKVADKFCPVATSTTVAIGTGIASVILAVGSDGGTAALQESLQQGARVAIKKATTKVVEKVADGTAKKFLKKQGAIFVGTAGTTLLAKMIVANRAAVLSANGTERGGSLVTAVDIGADLESSEISRTQQMGAPFAKGEVSKANARTAAYVKEQNSQKSTFNRYFAMSNPNSLASHMGITLYNNFHGASFASIANSFQTLLSPKTFASKLMWAVNPRASADTTGTGADYGNIQWGWTPEETALAKTEDYEVFENQLKLDQSGKEDEIADRYGKCFALETSIGTLLEEGAIVRDSNGDLTDDGDCSPKNLGYKNPKYGDLVFRWRLAQADSKDLDEKLNTQEITEDPTATDSGGGSDFNIATLNIYHSDHQSISDWGPRLHLSVSTLTKNDVSIAGLQEVRPDQMAAFNTDAFGATRYDMWPKTSSGKASDPDYNPNPIVYDRNKFTRVDQKYIGYKYFEGTSSKAPIIKLQDNTTQQQFYVANIHHPADVKDHGDASRWRLEDAQANAAYFKQLSSEGLPIFFTGDFNNRYDIIPGGTQNEPVGNKRENLTYCVLTADGVLSDAYDVSISKKGKCPSGATSDNHNAIDHIFVSSGVQIPDFANMQDVGKTGDNHNGSDSHSTIVAHAIIPAGAAASGSTGGWTWPLSKNDWNGPFGTNVWGSCSVKCRHAGVDISGTAGKTVLAAHSGTVKSVGHVTFSGGDCKIQVLIQATGTPYYYAYQHMGGVNDGIKPGATVTAGDPIGTVDRIGPTGACGSGAHLHFSIEKSEHVSEYADGAGVCDINQVDCAKKMTSYPPLCFLDADRRDYGHYVPANQTKGSDYCTQVVGSN